MKLEEFGVSFLIRNNYSSMKSDFEVENIKCNGCTNRIKSSLINIDGVEAVTISLELEKITVEGTFDREKIIGKLNELGYPEKGNNSAVKKAKSYLNSVVGRLNE